MLRNIVSFFTLLGLAGCTCCSQSDTAMNRYTDTGQAKPVVAIVPVINHSGHQLPWDMSEELTAGLRSELQKSGRFYLPSPEELSETITELGDCDFFSSDVQLAKAFCPTEYVVFLELMDHEETPYTRDKVRPMYPANGDMAKVLMISMRVKVVELKEGKSPRVVLNEIVHSNHPIGKSDTFTNYDQMKWGMRAYQGTALGMAHARLEKEVASRLEYYINFCNN